MATWVWIVVALAIVATILGIGLVAWAVARTRRSAALRARFGPEYDRLASEEGRATAEHELEEREERVASFTLRPLLATEANRFLLGWDDAQRRFVDDPGAAVVAADRLIGEVMRARGYPVGDFEQRADDISVEHPDVVASYRAAHAIAADQATGDGHTEDLRRAMVYYRSLFDDLVETRPSPGGPDAAPAP